jgi:hypothetical protein
MSTCTAPSAAAITLADPLSIAARSGGSTTSICASRSASPRPLVVVVVVVDAFAVVVVAAFAVVVELLVLSSLHRNLFLRLQISIFLQSLLHCVE